MMKLRTKVTAMVVAAAVLSAGPVTAASAAEASLARDAPAGRVALTVTSGSASTVTFDVGGGARPLKLEGGGIGVTDGTTTSDALPTSVSVGKGRTVSGAWSVDDADTVTFHFTVNVGGEVAHLDSDWTSDEWGHCVSGRGVAGAAGGGLLGAISGPGAITTATSGLLVGIIGGAITC